MLQEPSEGQAATSSAISIENPQLNLLQSALMLQPGVLLRPLHRLGNEGSLSNTQRCQCAEPCVQETLGLCVIPPLPELSVPNGVEHVL